MNRDIAILCAPPPGVNPGMESVDLAFYKLAERHHLIERIQFWHLFHPNRPQNNINQAKISYNIVPTGDEFFQAPKIIIYWGDFHHMHQYQNAVANKLIALGANDNFDSARMRVQDVLLQSRQNIDILRKTISFGSTLLFNTLQDDEDSTYGTALKRFIQNCKAIWFRDVFSANKACQISGAHERNYLGVDCATLINPTDLKEKQSRTNESAVGIFLGRSSEKIELMLDFASELSKVLGHKLAWLRWGDIHAFPPLFSTFQLDAIRSLDTFTDEPINDVNEAIMNLFNFQVIVTDTYHICVNAWNLGIPAICLVEASYSKSRNVNFGNYFTRRDKREIFMSMYDALDFLVPIEEFNHEELRTARITHLVDLINSQKAISSIQKKIRIHSESAEAMLVQKLSDLL